MPCCTILETSPCNKSSRQYIYLICNRDQSLQYKSTQYVPTPEVHSGDVCEPGPGSSTGLQEVLRFQHHPSHRPHALAVIMFNRYAH